MKYKPEESLRRTLKNVGGPKNAAAPAKAGAAEVESEVNLELSYEEEGPFAGDTASDCEDSKTDSCGEAD